MSTIFSKIVSGEIPAHKIAENKSFLAFLDVNPLAEGHTLVIPKVETDYLFNIQGKDYTNLWNFAQEVAMKIESRIDCKRIGVAVIGLEVAHAHIHLIPINSVSDMNFAKPKLNLTQDQLKVIAERINA